MVMRQKPQAQRCIATTPYQIERVSFLDSQHGVAPRPLMARQIATEEPLSRGGRAALFAR